MFPGNLQGRFFRETGPKGATVVRVNNGRVTLEEMLLAYFAGKSARFRLRMPRHRTPRLMVFMRL